MMNYIRKQLVKFRIPIQFLIVFALAFVTHWYFQRIGIQEALSCFDKYARNSCDAYALDGWAVGWLGAIFIFIAGSIAIIGWNMYASEE